jgi:hypothetical protein
VFVCRSSGYTHTYFLKKNSEAPDVLNEFLDDIKQSGHHPEHITIKSDAESVHIHGLFQQRCRKLGITSVYSPPHEHERNGSSEMNFRDIGDLAHTMMATSAIPSTGWTHFYRHAKLDDDTPYYRMFGKNYDMSNVRIFDYRAFVHIPLAQLTKCEPRAAEGVYVGHDEASSAYLIYFPATDRTKVVETPNFIEDVDTCLCLSPDRLHLRLCSPRESHRTFLQQACSLPRHRQSEDNL